MLDGNSDDDQDANNSKKVDEESPDFKLAEKIIKYLEEETSSSDSESDDKENADVDKSIKSEPISLNSDEFDTSDIQENNSVDVSLRLDQLGIDDDNALANNQSETDDENDIEENVIISDYYLYVGSTSTPILERALSVTTKIFEICNEKTHMPKELCFIATDPFLNENPVLEIFNIAIKHLNAENFVLNASLVTRQGMNSPVFSSSSPSSISAPSSSKDELRPASFKP